MSKTFCETIYEALREAELFVEVSKERIEELENENEALRENCACLEVELEELRKKDGENNEL